MLREQNVHTDLLRNPRIRQVLAKAHDASTNQSILQTRSRPVKVEQYLRHWVSPPRLQLGEAPPPPEELYLALRTNLW